MTKCVFATLVLFVAAASGIASPTPKHLSAIADDQEVIEPRYRHECWMKRPVKLAPGRAALFQKAVRSQRGDDEPSKDAPSKDEPSKELEEPVEAEAPEPVKPDVSAFETVLKDGFLRAECVTDWMYSYGDMWGKGKFSYKFGKDASRSIVRYDEFVAKEDQVQMTPRVCFEFCRTVPNMGFFGMVNGRTCYCTPYYKTMAGDSSMCDEVCPGAPEQTCGGKSKSQIFEMHMCDDSKENLKASADKAGKAAIEMDGKASAAMSLSEDMQNGAAALQASFGAMGDSAATDLMQRTKVFAGFLEHAAEYVQKSSAKINTLIKSASDEKVTESIRASEQVTKSIDNARASGEALASKLNNLMADASYPGDSAYAGAAKQYYPVMYFVDKAFVSVPQTCGGSTVGTPKGQTSLDGCARACDEQVHTCVAFSYYAEQELCFLMSKINSAFYYTGCKSEKTEKLPPLEFLQKSTEYPSPADVSCMVKFSEFEGTTLKPDPSGKCKQCLKGITKADRCYKAAGGGEVAPKSEDEPPPKEEEPPKSEIAEEPPAKLDVEEEVPPKKVPPSEAEDEFDDLEGMDDWEDPWAGEFDTGSYHDGEFDDEWDELEGEPELEFRLRHHYGSRKLKWLRAHKGKHTQSNTNKKLS